MSPNQTSTNRLIGILLLILSSSAWMISSAAVVPSENASTLIYTALIHRHGERTPLLIYPNDPYREDQWPIGLGQITNDGKERLYNLGIWIRNRYKSLLGDHFNVSNIKVLSSDRDRTIMSAECLLASLYPPTAEEEWNKKLYWQPIPLHTIEHDNDNLLARTKPCPKYDEELDNLMKISAVKKIINNYKDLISYVSEYSGIKFKHYNVPTFRKVVTVYDTLLIEKKNNLTLPSWTNPVMEELSIAFPTSFMLYHYTTKMQRLSSGPLLKAILEEMESKVDQKDPLVRNLTLYSAHDSTITALLCALKSFNMIVPPFGSSVLFELYEEPDNEYTVKVLYRNETDHEPYQLNIENCPYPCNLKEFSKALSDVIPEDWDEECKTGQFIVVSDLTPLYVIIPLSIILLIGFASLVRCLLKQIRRKYKGYVRY